MVYIGESYIGGIEPESKGVLRRYLAAAHGEGASLVEEDGTHAA